MQACEVILLGKRSRQPGRLGGNRETRWKSVGARHRQRRLRAPARSGLIDKTVMPDNQEGSLINLANRGGDANNRT